MQSLWFMPAVFVIVSLAIGYLLSQVDVSEDSFLANFVFKAPCPALASCSWW